MTYNRNVIKKYPENYKLTLTQKIIRLTFRYLQTILNDYQIIVTLMSTQKKNELIVTIL